MRMVFQAYLTDSIEAADCYCKAFNGEMQTCFKSEDETFYVHAEIVVNGQTVLAVSEKSHYEMDFANGNNMQFWLTFDDEKSLNTAYDVLKENAEIHWPLSECVWCRSMADLTDKFGIRWCLNIF